ncbi:hypothetical protein [Petropleomorpha daqingensis]|uniref:Uncharacterized protein n=1 Tax=Petropleomorpha daqingensis TaxID=2026353 RepID=A0A853CLR0_9ACTN|nr:hypothetical protein [Petropleomorpha daqingensis]NYJ08356.1 hypothetical protein [Petropleomorpha daqingensis]
MTAMPRPDVPVRSAAELTERWAGLLEPPIFRRRELWLAWFDQDGLMLPMVVPVDDVPLVPDLAMLDGLEQVNAGVIEEHLAGRGALAMALCRPGTPAVRDDDRVWADTLRAALDGRWSLHLAAGGRVTPLVEPPDGPPTR